MPRKPTVLFLFPHPAGQLAQETRSGKQPSERLYGINELVARGWQITISDARFERWMGRIVTRLKYHGFNLIDLATLKQIRGHDVVMVKDDLSLPISLACKLFGAKLVYYDSMFQPPRKWLDRVCSRYALKYADVVLTYSDYQIDLWCKAFDLPRAKFSKIPYAMDSAYYLKSFPPLSNGDYVLSIGRDLGRDFKTLVAACKKLRVKLKLVTLDYLIQDIGLPDPLVEVIQNISYETLFELYAGAAAVALPLKKDIHYPSGIRAALECLLVSKPLVVTQTPVLQEMLPESRYKFFAKSEDEDDLAAQLQRAMRLGNESPQVEGRATGDRHAPTPGIKVASVDDLGDSLDRMLKSIA